MKKFLLRVFGFLIGVVCLLGVAEYLARTCPNAYTQKEHWMEKHASEVETLILGLSHTYASIDPEYLQSKAYNLANSNQTQRYDWLLLAQDTAALTSLKAIVYPSSSFKANYPLEDTSEWYRCIYYQLYNHCKVHSAFSKYAFEVASIQTCRTKAKRRLMSGQADRMCDEWGHCTSYLADASNQANLTEEKLQERLKIYNEREGIRTPKEQYFDLIADYCQRHHIRLILVGVPVSGIYAKNAEGLTQLSAMDQTAKQCCNRYSCIEYHDYSQDTRFEDRDFYDVDHLNSNGAIKFTTILQSDFSL